MRYIKKTLLLLLILTLIENCKKNQDNLELFALLFLSNTSVDPRYEPGEEYSGGETTSFDVTTVNAFDHGASNLSRDRFLRFESGNSFFNTTWTNPGSSARDGLGPFFINDSCRGCHIRDGVGSAPKLNEKINAMTIQISLSNGIDSNGGPLPVPEYGLQLNNRDIYNNQKPEANPMVIGYDTKIITFPDGYQVILKKPIFNLNFNYGEPADYVYSPRIAPKIIGLGLLAAIKEEDILSRADENDLNNDGISGKPNYVWNKKTMQIELGRFGWKANQPTIDQQNQGAFNGEIGITTPLFPDENCTLTSHPSIDCNNPPSGNSSPEVNQSIVELVEFYTHLIAVPVRRNYKDSDVLLGKEIFFQIGCESCHRQKYITGNLQGFPEVSNQKIYPYTDLLLHDMGDDLKDDRKQFQANGKEWRTPPLWGLGLVQRVNSNAGFLHDGRAQTIEEAILWHGGEAEQSKQKYVQLSRSEREALIKFLNSL
ncbi:MAG: thiol oxidoreductase [Leptospiraceae bacterium]|nr:MAG: thiol oxidoreductase [Leptospiraceae bacterium]